VADTATESLTYAVRLEVIAKRGGQLAVLLAALTTAPVLVAFAAGEQIAAWRYTGVAGALALLGGLLARRAAPGSIQVNEALVITALAFTLAPLAMTYPAMASGIDFTDALFECVSGITTTGLTVLGSVEDKPVSFLFERAWLNWIGGLGIVVLSVALLAGSDLAAGRLIESPVSPETLDTSTRLHARRSLAVYSLLTAAAIALLWFAGWSGFDAVVFSFAAISTGGFAPYDANVAAAPLWSGRLAVIAVAAAGAVSLPLYRMAWRTRGKALFVDPEVRLLLLAGLFTTVLLMLLMLRAQAGWSPELAGHAFAMAFSAQTTSGFSTMSPVRLDDASQLVLIGVMAAGGGVGSTAGGIKLLRVLLLIRIAQLILRRTAMPGRAIAFVRLRGRDVSGEDVSGALFVVVLFVVTVVLSWLPFLAAGHAPLASLFDVVSAVSTTGLSAGVAAPDLQPWLKGVLCVDMLLGRVEFVALLVTLYPPTWFGRRRST